MDRPDQPDRQDSRADRLNRPQQVRGPHGRTLNSAAPLFRFSQVEVPWELGPAPGRYLVRAAEDPDGPAQQVLVLALLGAPERRRLGGRRATKAPAEPSPTPVSTGKATIIQTGTPFADRVEAEAWIRGIDEEALDAGLAVLNRALRAYRLLTADPDVQAVGRSNLLVARLGFGAGEQVADGLWSEARELKPSPERRSRIKVLQPQARLAAVLGGRERILVCEELLLRARQDLEEGHEREAALGLLVTLDAALAELSRERSNAPLADRLDELRDQRDPVTAAAQAALAGPLSAEARDVVRFVTGRIEAALRARAVARA